MASPAGPEPLEPIVHRRKVKEAQKASSASGSIFSTSSRRPTLESISRVSTIESAPVRRSQLGHLTLVRSQSSSSSKSMIRSASFSGIGESPALNVDLFASLRKPEQLAPLPRLEEARQDIRLPTVDTVPSSLRDLDLFKAIELFKLYDMKTGAIDKNRFFKLLTHALALKGNRDEISKARSDRFFEDVDIDNSGTVEQDEFMGWLFATTSNYVAAIRKRLADMTEASVLKFYKEIDKNGNGQLDKDEFWQFVRRFCPDGLSREASDELFVFIDADNSGELDLDELLNWIHPGRPLKDTAPSKLCVGRPPPWQRAEAPQLRHQLFETRPGKPTTIHFTVGLTFESTLRGVQFMLQNFFSRSQIKVTWTIDPNCKTCDKVVAKVGRGVVLWDRGSMISYREDPFNEDKAKAFNWLWQILSETLPYMVQTRSSTGNVPRRNTLQ